MLRFLGIFVLFFLTCCVSHTPVEGVSRSSKPYCINGKYYYPQNYYEYSGVGLASWYGPGFHGRKNACGYKFNQFKYTAAHRTLPLPSIVRVTNLSNGKSVLVLVDDRGPYVDTHSRVIDLSYAAAKKIDALNKGVARVYIECLPQESLLFSNYLSYLYRYYGARANICWIKLFEKYYPQPYSNYI